MRYRTIGATVGLALAALLAFTPGCGGGENNGTTGSGSSSGSGGSGGGDTTTSSTTSSSSSSSSSTGGGGGGAPEETGESATETVSAGTLAKSSKHTMVFTLGQPTQNQGSMTSSGHRLQGGLIGSNGSLK